MLIIVLELPKQIIRPISYYFSGNPNPPLPYRYLRSSNTSLFVLIFIRTRNLEAIVHIITTGGTIEGLEYDNEQDKPKNDNVSIECFLNTSNLSLEYSIHSVFSKGSRFLTRKDRKLIAEKLSP